MEPAMAQQTLEERVTVLERKVCELEEALKDGKDDKAWQRTFGMFKGDETMKRIFEYGRKWREEERRKARRGKSKSGKAKA
jgi:hypothetical protein